MCIPFFLKHVEKRPYFYPNFSRLIISQSRSKGWEPQSVVPNQDRKVGNHNLWFPSKVKGLGTTTCGSQAKLKGWEPQSVVPKQGQRVGNHNLWFPSKIKRLGTTICGSQPLDLDWEPQIVVPNLLILIEKLSIVKN